MKKISIEELLTWAFTMELPKVGTLEGSGPSAAPSTWGILSDVITLGTMVDKSPNMYGVISGYVWEGEAHPDALIVGATVRELDDRDLDIGDGWNPFPEWEDEHGLIREEVESVANYHRERGGRINGRHVAALITSAAVLRRGPDWTAEEPRAVMVMNAGKPAWFVKRKCRDSLGRMVEYEDNGFDKRRHKPVKGAYRKYRLKQSLRAAIVSRMEWQIWQSALSELRDSLAGRLHGHDLLPFRPNMQPWMTIRKYEEVNQAIDIAAE